MQECEGFNVVIVIRDGEMIGRFVLQRINAAYKNKSTQMTYSNVLGFDEFEKVPFSLSWEGKKKNLYEGIFSDFFWSFQV